MLEGDPAMTLIQLDVKEGNVNDIVNESIRSTYQVGHLHLPTISGYISGCISDCSVIMLQKPVMVSQFAVLCMSWDLAGANRQILCL